MLQFRRIVSPLTVIENIAISRSIRELRRLRRLTVEGVGAKLKAQPRLNCLMAKFVWLSCIGMKRTESERKK